MHNSRRALLLAALSEISGSTVADRICVLCLKMNVDTAAILVQSVLSPAGEIASAGLDQVLLSRLERDLGEGPAHQALATKRPVLASSLHDRSDRWPIFATEALREGLAAVFAFPLHLGSIDLGVLITSRRTPGELDLEDFLNLQALADLSTLALLHAQDGLLATDHSDLLSTLDVASLRVQQATGMAAEQAQVDIATALALMRAHALSNEVSLAEVADAILSKKVRMDT